MEAFVELGSSRTSFGNPGLGLEREGEEGSAGRAGEQWPSDRVLPPRRVERATHRLLLPPVHSREGRDPPGHWAARAPEQCPQRRGGRHL